MENCWNRYGLVDPFIKCVVSVSAVHVCCHMCCYVLLHVVVVCCDCLCVAMYISPVAMCVHTCVCCYVYLFFVMSYCVYVVTQH